MQQVNPSPASGAAATPPGGQRPGRRILSRSIRVLGFGLGLGLLIWLIRAAGPERILEHLRSLGWWSLAVVVVSGSWFVCNGWGWWLTFQPRVVRFGRLLQTLLISEAVSNVTPFMALGGEPLKILLLGPQAGRGVVLASVVNDNVVHVITAVLFMLAGLGWGLLLFDIDPQIVALLLGTFAFIAFGTFLLVRRSRRGLLVPLVALARRLRLPLPSGSGDLLERAAEVDRQIGHFLVHRRKDFLGCLTGHLAGRLLGAVEAWVILHALGTPVSLGTAIFLIAVIHVLVNMIFSVIPSQLGVQEGVAYLLFGAIGLDPSAAVALALIRRIRGFFWIGVGFLLFALVPRSAPAPAPAESTR